MVTSDFDRRAFLRSTGLMATSAVLGEALLSACSKKDSADPTVEYKSSYVPPGSMLEHPASASPIDHVVLIMMENRSFDHYLGWLAKDGEYLQQGVSKYGPSFRIDGKQHLSFKDPSGKSVDTWHLDRATIANAARGCGYRDPGHTWGDGRAQRDRGFLGKGSRNDRFALGYYEMEDLPLIAAMAKRFTTFDRYHASLLASSNPNREYLHAAQSGGHKNNHLPFQKRGFDWPTIWDQLRKAGVPVCAYVPDLPSLAMFGSRMHSMMSPISRYFEDCAAGKLPSVTFLDPPFMPQWRADDHPMSDPSAGQRYLRDVFRAFVESPHWQKGLFILVYDEWGGFFDHLPPATFPDDRASRHDANNFGQGGFRVPIVLASPWARRGYVDHRTYEHTSIMRFLQWRFLGAPPEGTSANGAAQWWLTKRNRYANNIGSSLLSTGPDPEVGFDFARIPLLAITASCKGQEQVGYPSAVSPQPTGTLPPPPVGASTTTSPSTTSPSTTSPSTTGPAPTGGALGDDTPTTATARGSGSVEDPVHRRGDMYEMLDSGYLEWVGFDPNPSDIAGHWISTE